MALFVCACSSPEGEVSDGEQQSGESSDELSTGSSKECVVDTVIVAPGLLADLKAALGTKYLKNYGPGLYPHLEVRGAFDAALSTDVTGEFFYTVVGMSYHPERLLDDSGATPRRMATLEAGSVRDAKLKTAKKNFAAAKAMFDAMTRATETVDNHIVPQPSYDRSYVKTTRRSPAGRVVCTSTTYPDQSGHVEYACTFSDVESNRVQIFDVDDAGGKCLPK
jgi:hypothetical protein